MGKIKKDSRQFINDLDSYRAYNDYVERNKVKLQNDRAVAVPLDLDESGANEFDLTDLTEDQQDLAINNPEELVQISRLRHLQEQNQKQLEEERQQLFKEQQEAFEKEDLSYFDLELGSKSSNLLSHQIAETVNKATSSTPLGEDNSFLDLINPLSDSKLKAYNRFGYSVTAGIDDIGAFFSAPLSFRLPTFQAFGIKTAQTQGLDGLADLYNNYMDDVKLKGKTGNVSGVESLINMFQDNETSKGFREKAEINRAIAETYKLSDKTITKDGWAALGDVGYWADTVASGLGSAASFLGGGAAIQGLNKVATLGRIGNTANTLLTAAALTNIEGSQIATDTAAKVYKATLDSETNEGFSAGEQLFVTKKLEEAAAFANEQGKNLDAQTAAEIEVQAKNAYLQDFLENNPELAQSAHEKATLAYSQAAKVNNANFFLNLTGAGLLVKGLGKEAVKSPIKTILSNFVKEGVQESIEEGVVNNLAEKSGFSLATTGKYDLSDISRDLLSLEAAEQAFAGFITGGLMSGGATAINYNSIKDTYTRQKEVIEKYNKISETAITTQDLLLTTALASARNHKVSDLLADYSLARATNNNTAAAGLESLIIAEQVSNALNTGTLVELENMYKKIAINDSNSAETKTKANEVLGQIKSVEKKLNANSNYLNSTDITANEVVKERFEQQLPEINNKRDTILNKLADHLATFSKSAGLNTTNPLENPYVYDPNSTESLDDYNSYNEFLKADTTQEILKEYTDANLQLEDVVNSVNTLSEKTQKLKSRETQKQLKVKENLIYRLKGLKASIFDKNIKAANKKLNQEQVSEVYNKLSTTLSPENTEAYNNRVDELSKEFESVIPKAELEALKNVFKLTNKLSDGEVEVITAAATNAILNDPEEDAPEVETTETPENIPNPEVIDAPDSVGDVGTVEEPDPVTNPTITDEPDPNVDVQITDEPDPVIILQDLVNENSEILLAVNDKLNAAREQLAYLTDLKSKTAVALDYYDREINSNYDDAVIQKLTEAKDKVAKKLALIDETLASTEEYIAVYSEVAANGNIVLDTVNNDFANLLPLELTPETVNTLTESQQLQLADALSLLGSTRDAIDTASNKNQVVNTTNEESSILRTFDIPYSKFMKIRNNKFIFDKIESSYKNFLDFIDNPDNEVLGSLITYTLDRELIDYFKTIIKFGDENSYPGVNNFFNFLNKGQKIDVNTLSDKLILALPIKAELDPNSYTYLIDDGYFYSMSTSGEYTTFADGRKVSNTEVQKYKERVIQEKRAILNDIIYGTAQSIIKYKSTGYASRRAQHHTLSNVEGFDADTNLFIVLEDGTLTGNGTSTATLSLSNTLFSGNIGVPLRSTTNEYTVDGLTNTKLDQQTAELVFEAIRFILDNPSNINEYMEVYRDNTPYITGITPLSLLDMFVDLGMTNSLLDPKFQAELNNIARLAQISEQDAIKYLTTKFSSYKKEGINSGLIKALNSINTLKGVNKTEKVIRDNAVIGKYTASNSYNSVIADHVTTNLNKLTKEKSNIVTERVTPREFFNPDIVNEVPIPFIAETAPDLGGSVTGANSDDLAFSTTSSLEDLQADGTIPMQLKWLAENLPQLPAEEYDTIIPVLNDRVALGYFFTGLEVLADGSKFGIRYSKNQPTDPTKQGIIYHEAFHGVVRTLISKQEYDDLLKIEDEEVLAEAFRDYIVNGISYSDPKVNTLFERILNYIATLIGISDEAKVNKLFNDIATGKYKHAQVYTERISDFGKAYSSIAINTYLAKEAAPSLAMAALDNTSLEVISKVTNSDIASVLERTRQIHLSRGVDTAEAKAFLEIRNAFDAVRYTVGLNGEKTENNNNIFVLKTNNFIESILQQDIIEEAGEYEGTSDNTVVEDTNTEISDISKHTKDTSLIDYELKAPKFIKMALASLPKLDNDGNTVFNPVTGLRQAVDFKSTYNSLLHYLEGSYNDIMLNDNNTIDPNELAINKIFTKFKTLQAFKPELRNLYKYLTLPKDASEEQANLVARKKGLFYSAISLNRTPFVSVVEKITAFELPSTDPTQPSTTKQAKTVNIYTTAKEDIAFEVIQKWFGLSTYNKFITTLNDVPVYNITEIAKVKDNKDTLVNSINERLEELKKEGRKLITQEAKNNAYTESLNDIIYFLANDIGINVNANALNLMIYEQGLATGIPTIVLNDSNNSNYTTTGLHNLLETFKNITSDFVPNKPGGIVKLATTSGIEARQSDIFSAFKRSYKTLSSYQYLFQDHIGSAAVKGPEYKTIFLFDYQSTLANKFNFFNSGATNAKTYLDTLLSKADHSNSLYAQDILDNNISQFRLLSFNTDLDNNDGVDGTSMSYKKDLLMNLHMSLNSFLNPEYYKSYIRMLSFADKSTSDIFYSVPHKLIKSPIRVVDGDIVVNEETTQVFYNYLLSELQRVLNPTPTTTKNLTTHKDTVFLFPEFSPSNHENNPVAKYLHVLKEKGININADIRTLLDQFPTVKDEINKQILKFIQSEIELHQSNLVEESDIDSKLLAKFRTLYGDNALNAMIATAAINGVIGNIETTKLFTGPLSTYKDTTDFLKRTPFINSKGYAFNVTDKLNSKFKVAVIKTKKIPSSLYTKEVVEGLRPILEKTYQAYINEKNLKKTVADFKTDIDKKLDSIVEAYSKLDITDAQGYITLDRWYDVMKGLGRDSVAVKELYDKLKNETATFEDHKKAQQFLQPIKGVAHQLVVDNTPYTKVANIKYSQFILTPALVKNSKGLQDLYDKMTANGIDEAVYDSSFKGEYLSINNTTDEAFTFQELDKSAWKLQVDFTPKTYKGGDTQVSTQFMKNVKANVRFTDTYAENLTGHQLIKNVNLIESLLINRKGYKFYKETTLKNIALELNTVSLLQKEALRTNDLASMPQLISIAERAYNSRIKKDITEMTMPGGAFIQASPEFFTVDVTDGNVRWLIDKKELTGSTVNKGAYILLPYNVIANLTDEQIAKAEIDPRVLNGVGVRIPNQPKSSIDKITIAGFLPRSYGDTVVVYNEGTKKFGYDFDVDKKYIILPKSTYNKETNRIEYVETPNDSNFYSWSNDQLKNKLLEYWNLLIENHFDEIIEPLDADWLRQDIVEAGANLDVASGMGFYSTSYQLQVKRNNTLAKNLIGPFANFTSDIASNQYANVFLPFKIGIGNKTSDGFMDLSKVFDEDGNMITSTGLQYQNASVDAAKDPYIINGNINDFTSSIVVLLVKAGVGRKFPVQLVGHPIIREYTILRENGLSHSAALRELTGNNTNILYTADLEALIPELQKAFKLGAEVFPMQVLAAFNGLYAIAGVDTKQTLASKIDVDGGGNTFVDKFVLKENIRSILNLSKAEFEEFNAVILGKIPLSKDLLKMFNHNASVKNFVYKFVDKTTSTSNLSKARLTTLGSHYKTAVLQPQEELANDVLMFSTPFEVLSDRISNLLGEYYLTNKKTVTAIYNAFYNTTIKQSFNNNTSTLAEKLNSTTGLASKIESLLVAQPAIGANSFINQLIFNKDVKINQTFINIDGRKVKNKADDIIYGFKQLMDGVYGEEAMGIANELIEYSIQSGVTYTNKSFFRFIPPTAFSNSVTLPNKVADIIDEFFRHNVYSNDIVPQYTKGRTYFDDKTNRVIINQPIIKNGVMARFIKMRVKGENKLYQYIETQESTAEDGRTVEKHIYQETYKLGYTGESGSYNEYGLGNTFSFNRLNNVKVGAKPNYSILNVTAIPRNTLKPPTPTKFEGKLIYAMPGSGKTTAMKNNLKIVEPEPLYKKLLGNDSILKGQEAVTDNYKNREALEPIHNQIVDWVNEKLNSGYTVVSGLSFLADGVASGKYTNIVFNNAVILDSMETFKDRVRNRKEDAINENVIDVTKPVNEDGTFNTLPDDKKYMQMYEKYKLKAASLGVNVVSLGKDEFLDNYINAKIDRLSDNNLSDNIVKPC